MEAWRMAPADAAMRRAILWVSCGSPRVVISSPARQPVNGRNIPCQIPTRRETIMFVIDDIAVAVGVHYLVAHGSAALAVKGAAMAQHPVSTAATMAVHHGVGSFISNAIFSEATSTVPAAINVVHVPILNQAVLSHGAAGATGAVTALHDAIKFGLPVAAGLTCQRLRKSERYRDMKNDLSVLLDKAMAAL
jgi:hypothetical protein